MDNVMCISKIQYRQNRRNQARKTALNTFLGTHSHPNFMFAKGNARKVCAGIGSNGNTHHEKLLHEREFAHKAENKRKIDKGNKADTCFFHVCPCIFMGKMRQCVKSAQKSNGANTENSRQGRQIIAQNKMQNPQSAEKPFICSFFVFWIKKREKFPLRQESDQAKEKINCGLS